MLYSYFHRHLCLENGRKKYCSLISVFLYPLIQIELKVIGWFPPGPQSWWLVSAGIAQGPKHCKLWQFGFSQGTWDPDLQKHLWSVRLPGQTDCSISARTLRWGERPLVVIEQETTHNSEKHGWLFYGRPLSWKESAYNLNYWKID